MHTSEISAYISCQCLNETAFMLIALFDSYSVWITCVHVTVSGVARATVTTHETDLFTPPSPCPSPTVPLT